MPQLEEAQALRMSAKASPFKAAPDNSVEHVIEELPTITHTQLTRQLHTTQPLVEVVGGNIVAVNQRLKTDGFNGSCRNVLVQRLKAAGYIPVTLL